MAITASLVMELRTATGAGMMDCKKALQEVDGDLEAAKDYLRKKGISVAAKKSDRQTNEGSVAIRIAEDGRSGALVQLACETDFVARNDEFGSLMDLLTLQVFTNGDTDVLAQPLLGGEEDVAHLITKHIGRLGENMQFVAARRLVVEGEGALAGYVHSNSKIGVLVAVGSDGPAERKVMEALARDLSMHVAASQVSALDADGIDPAELEKEREIYAAQAAESGKPPEIVAKMVEGRIKKFIKEVALLDQSFVKNPDLTIRQLLTETSKETGTTLSVQQFAKLQF